MPNKIMLKLWLFVFICTLPLPALARIGETKAECVERYGQPLKQVGGGDYLVFTKFGFGIVAHLHNDKVDMIIYMKINLEEISEREIEILLNNNGSDWMDAPREKSARGGWMSKDGATWASYVPLEHQLLIATAAYLDRSPAWLQ